MSNSIENMFNTDGSPLGVPVSPNTNPITDPAVSIVGNSQLHNQYSNIGNPTLNNPAYQNFGAGTLGYTNPPTSQLGETADSYQEPVNRYANNLPPGAAGL